MQRRAGRESSLEIVNLMLGGHEERHGAPDTLS